MTKSGFVAILGKPNAGKSTLLNALLGQKLSISTNKPQTTRKRILGILSEEDYQIVFLDTPGILRPEYLLQKKMLEYTSNSTKDADVLLFLIDAKEDPDGKHTLEDEYVASILQDRSKRKILVLNKADLTDQKRITSLMRNISAKNLFDEIIPASALSGFNLDSILAKLLEFLPEGPKFYPDDQISESPERFFVSEIIREQIFELYRDEVPYSTEVLIEEFKEREGDSKDYISAAIVVERESQKPIIIGHKGESIKKLGAKARGAVEDFLDRQVYLELRVKVREDWRRSPSMLKSFGYDTEYEE